LARGGWRFFARGRGINPSPRVGSYGGGVPLGRAGMVLGDALTQSNTLEKQL
jgi:hypothetical protein